MYQYPFLDFSQLNESINSQNIISSEKLRYIHKTMNGSFYDPDENIMTGASLGIVSIGGFPISIFDNQLYINGAKTSVEDIQSQLLQTVGISSFMSYLNPKNKTLLEMADTTLESQHLSVLHTLHLSILISGISIGVEHEFSSQRDIIHLSRLTVAKTKAQDNPCLVLRDKTYLNEYLKVLNFIKTQTPLISDTETRNLLFPSAKASTILITASFKNLLKLVSLKDAGGKEEEFIEILLQIQKALSVFQKFYV